MRWCLTMAAIMILTACSVQKQQWRRHVTSGDIDSANYISLVKGQRQLKKMNRQVHKFWRQK